MTFKLVDLYGTKFFYKTFSKDLYYLFTSIIRIRDKEKGFTPNIGNAELGKLYEAVRNGEQIEIDLADARITNDALSAVYMAESGGIVLCDSKDKWRDEIFKENARRQKIDVGKIILPEFGYKTDIREYIAALDTNTVYNAAGQSNHLLIALVCLTFMVRPSIKICVDNIARPLFKYINTKLPTEEILASDKFFMCTDEGVWKVNADNIYVQEAQKVLPVKEALQYAILVPVDFGEKVLLHNTAYQGLFRSCLLILQEFQESSSKTLEEIYA